jgi:hypothetical protein
MHNLLRRIQVVRLVTTAFKWLQYDLFVELLCSRSGLRAPNVISSKELKLHLLSSGTSRLRRTELLMQFEHIREAMPLPPPTRRFSEVQNFILGSCFFFLVLFDKELHTEAVCLKRIKCNFVISLV